MALMLFARDGSRAGRVALLPAGATYSSPRWSPDDRLIAFQSASSSGWDVALEVVTIDTGERRHIAGTDRVNGFCWRPDGTGFIYSSSHGNTLLYPPIFNLRTIDLDGRQDHQLTFGDDTYVDPDAQHAGRLVACRIRSQSDVWKFPVDGPPAENARNAIRITRQTGHAQTVSVSPDDSEVVYLSDSGGHSNLWVARTDTGIARQITFERDPHISIGAPGWSPAGDLIVFVTRHRGVADLWTIRPDGSGLRQLVTNAWAASWSRDGKWVYYMSLAERAERIEKVAVAGGPPIVVRRELGSRQPAVSADGSVLYYGVPLGSIAYGYWGAGHEIRRATPEQGPADTIARISSGRVTFSSRMLHMVLSPDDRWLAMPLLDGATSNIWALPTTGGPMRPLTDFGERFIVIIRNVSWSADSRHVYAAVAEAETDIILFDGLIA
jgi:Tol biopolymer transport system component